MKDWPWSRISIVFTLVVGLAVTMNLHWGKDHWREVIKADARAYNAYLPAAFIYQDLQFGFFNEMELEKYYDPNLVYHYRYDTGKGIVNRYFAGTAVMQAPFFFAARAWAWISGEPDDGYSRPFMLMITLAGLFYLVLGLSFINGFLKNEGVSEVARAILIPSVAFGTHLFNYSIVEPGMSHVYSFALVAGFILAGQRLFKSEDKRLWLVLGLITGLIILVRPVNGIVILSLPFLAGGLGRFIKSLVDLIKSPLLLGLSLLIGLSIVGIQSAIYWSQIGNLWVYSYDDEGFNWSDPHMWDILFSYKKGLFVYTPMLLVACFGSAKMWQRNSQQTVLWTAFMVITVYVLSSWWSWWYGGSFSGRAFVEFIPFFAIPLGLLLNSIKRKGLAITFSALLLLTALNQFQTYQYRYYIIHWDQMDSEKYWDVFLSLEKPEQSE